MCRWVHIDFQNFFRVHDNKRVENGYFILLLSEMCPLTPSFVFSVGQSSPSGSGWLSLSSLASCPVWLVWSCQWHGEGGSDLKHQLTSLVLYALPPFCVWAGSLDLSEVKFSNPQVVFQGFLVVGICEDLSLSGPLIFTIEVTGDNNDWKFCAIWMQ